MAKFRVRCPTCNAELELDAAHAGKEVECGSCLQVFTAPDKAEKKKPYKARPDRDADEEEDRPSRRRHRPRRDDYDEYDYSPPRARGGAPSDVPGVVGLVLGCVAIICLVLGCFTCGATYVIAVPLALAGGVFSFFGKTGLRVAGLVLNILVLIPAVIIIGLWFLGMGAAVIAPGPRR